MDLFTLLSPLFSPHWLLAPIVLPLATAAVLLLLREEQRRLKVLIQLLSCSMGLGVAVLLLMQADAPSGPSGLGAYLPGNWPAPFGIVLALDRLSALMLVLTATLGLVAACYAAGGWYRAGVHFHPLLQFQLMGLGGAFLTADLFNLFVFFEITLAASYGLLLHGSGPARIGAGLHYVAVNLVASALFLVGVSMLYGITGTLNMADLARSVAEVAPADRGLLHAAAAILGVAFLIKAAVWPLNFWLVPAYSAATAPVAALFALLTKLGLYAVLRLWTLLFGGDAGVSAGFAAAWLSGAGLVTLAWGALGLLASQRLPAVAGYAAVVSSGLLLAAVGLGQASVTAGLLFYLVSSTLGVALLFLLADLLERWREREARPAPDEATDDAPFLTPDLGSTQSHNLDDDEVALIGRPIPAGAAVLGLAFLGAVLLVAGLPPLPGFVGKVLIGQALLALPGFTGPGIPWALLLLALMMVSGLAALVTLTRLGMRHFWSAQGRGTPVVRVAEGVPVAALLALAVALTLHGEALLRYTTAAATALHQPAAYLETVLGAQPVPSPAATAGREGER